MIDPRGTAAGGRGRCAGMVLLEVVAALAILIFAAAVVLGALHSSIRGASQLKREAQAMDLAVTLLSRIELGMVPAQEQSSQAFEVPFEDWAWEAHEQSAELTATGADLKNLEVVVRHASSGFVLRMSAMVSPPPPGTAGVVPLGEDEP